ncbi:membrane lipoprotein lipid attachment site-containing protein [Zunongwangia endophytica]|uniref:Type IV secretion system putative lipoprotein virB7 n=1 Tax=Zunongwangia endophytica TaxID=1808945 RepID=A0ABV8H4C7_9FLAO|nr:membrane lipoprotein lipid attachment site-containing protein [Zunongwangia endophytica]MDN3595593.1 membrane lipoprotein lipid attachment site-containing protein [Zunongwangia endophytica]
MKKIVFLLFSLVILSSCSSNSEDDKPEVLAPAEINAEVDFFNFEIDTEARTTFMEYRMTFYNESDFDVEGYPQIYIGQEGVEDFSVTTERYNGENPCNYLEANSSCTQEFSELLSYDQGDLEAWSGEVPVLTLEDIQYRILEEHR